MHLKLTLTNPTLDLLCIFIGHIVNLEKHTKVISGRPLDLKSEALSSSSASILAHLEALR